jgi:subtilisin family serine protease
MGSPHATAVAGIAAGRGFNDTGIRGVAPEARLAGIRLGDSFDWKIKLGGEEKEDHLYPFLPALSYRQEEIDIYNLSMGYRPRWEEGYRIIDLLNAVATIGHGVNSRGQALGNIYVVGAGNAQNPETLLSTDTALASSRYTIAVAASDASGHWAPYSMQGANIFVNAPSSAIAPKCDFGPRQLGRLVQEKDIPEELEEKLGDYLEYINPGGWHLDQDHLLFWLEHVGGQEAIQTYSLLDYADIRPGDVVSTSFDHRYTHAFGGTSAATPFVSGGIALLLQKNPDLTWRDVQHILIETADKNPGENWDDGDHTNRAGYSHSYKYGFGRINIQHAVAMATTWPGLLDESIFELAKEKQTESTSVIDIPQEENVRIEYIEVEFNSKQPDVEVTLTSPHDTTSILTKQNGYGAFTNHTFGTVRHFGEPSAGRLMDAYRQQSRNRIL